MCPLDEKTKKTWLEQFKEQKEIQNALSPANPTVAARIPVFGEQTAIDSDYSYFPLFLW